MHVIHIPYSSQNVEKVNNTTLYVMRLEAIAISN